MTGQEALQAVRDTCELIAERHGLELVEVSLGPGGRDRVLSVTLDRLDAPPSLDEISEVSEEISRALDIEDPIDGSYLLEVSSAGLERPLTKPADFDRFTGREIVVKTSEPMDGRRTFQGELVSAGNDSFVVADATAGEAKILYTNTKRAKLVVDWDAELKGAQSAGRGLEKGSGK